MSKGKSALGRVAEEKPVVGVPLVVVVEPADAGAPPAVVVAAGAEHDYLLILIFELLVCLRKSEVGIAVDEEKIRAVLSGADSVVPLGGDDVEAFGDNGTGEVGEGLRLESSGRLRHLPERHCPGGFDEGGGASWALWGVRGEPTVEVAIAVVEDDLATIAEKLRHRAGLVSGERDREVEGDKSCQLHDWRDNHLQWRNLVTINERIHALGELGVLNRSLHPFMIHLARFDGSQQLSKKLGLSVVYLLTIWAW